MFLEITIMCVAIYHNFNYLDSQRSVDQNSFHLTNDNTYFYLSKNTCTITKHTNIIVPYIKYNFRYPSIPYHDIIINNYYVRKPRVIPNYIYYKYFYYLLIFLFQIEKKTRFVLTVYLRGTEHLFYVII